MDGLADEGEDPGCRLATSTTESPQCDDGLDNDGDGKRDWDGAGVGLADPQCSAGWDNREAPNPGRGLGAELALVLAALAALRRHEARPAPRGVFG